jgi:hypothetical protein
LTLGRLSTLLEVALVASFYALYASKHAGRNRVVGYSEISEP